MNFGKVFLLCLIGSTSCTEYFNIDYGEWQVLALSSLERECAIVNNSCSTNENEYDVWSEELTKLKMTKVLVIADSLAQGFESLDSITIISSLYYGYDLENVGSSTIVVHSESIMGFRIDSDFNLSKVNNPNKWISELNHFQSGCNYSLDFVTSIRTQKSKDQIHVKTILGRDI